MFHYIAYGLGVSSALEIPPFAAGEGEPPHVTIRTGPVPEALEQSQMRGVCFQAGRDGFLLHLPGIARYLVRHGRQITIDQAPQAQGDAVLPFLLNTVFGALLQQRGLLVLHGSAIATERGAILFVGLSASGKSTLAGEFWRRGYRVLADDLCAIDAGPGRPRLWPAHPCLQIWADAALQLNIPTERLRRIRSKLEKYWLTTERFSTAAVPVVAVYQLETTNMPEIALTTPTGFDKFRTLTDHTFHLRFIKGMQLLGQHFQQIQGLVKHVRVACLRRPRFPFRLQGLADVVEKDFS